MSSPPTSDQLSEVISRRRILILLLALIGSLSAYSIADYLSLGYGIQGWGAGRFGR